MEQWLPVVGFEGMYEVSSLGRVGSLPREIVVLGRNGPFTRRLKGKLLSVQRYGSGHFYAVLCRSNQDFHIRIHHLVLEAFVGPRPEGALGLHRDDNPNNNAVENLYWGTYSDNQYDKVNNGNHHNANKTRCPRNHEYTEANTIRWRDGARRCRACREGRR